MVPSAVVKIRSSVKSVLVELASVAQIKLNPARSVDEKTDTARLPKIVLGDNALPGR